MQRAFVRELYDKYYDIVFQYCMHMLNFDEASASDCAHAAFDRAEAQYEKLATHPNVAGWLMTTAKHMVYKQWRRNKENLLRMVSIDLIAAIPDRHDPYDLVELTSADIERISELVLSCLKPKERELYQLYFVDGHSFAQAAEILGISEKAVRARLARIKVKLKDRLAFYS